MRAVVNTCNKRKYAPSKLFLDFIHLRKKNLEKKNFHYKAEQDFPNLLKRS